MRSRITIIGMILTLLMPAGLAGADKHKAAPPAPIIAKLAWLAGNWHLEKSGRVMDEQWMAPVGGVMLGMSRTVAKGRVVEQAFRQIREGPGGDLFYVLQLAGQPEAAYQSSTVSETEIVFENPERDYPRKISYRLQPDGGLQVVLEGVDAEGQPRLTQTALQKAAP